MGFTETSLQDHVTSEHAETSTEVVSVVPSRSGTGRASARAEAGPQEGGEGPAHVGATFPDVGQEAQLTGLSTSLVRPGCVVLRAL